MKMVLSLIFISLFSTIVMAQQKDTPLVHHFREIYNANYMMARLGTHYRLTKCSEMCTDVDINNMREQAAAADMFAMSMGIFHQPENIGSLNILKNNAEIGEPIGLIFTAHIAMIPNGKDYILAEKYAKQAMEKGYTEGYFFLIRAYIGQNKISHACEVVQNGYKKFGIEFLSEYLQEDQYEDYKVIFPKCLKKTPQEILSKAGNNEKLINAFILTKKKQYKEAYKVFTEIYKEGDTSKVSINAAYCLGMMNYYGKGTQKSIEKGRQLLKESYNNGVYFPDSPEMLKQLTIPEIKTYNAISCAFIEKKQ